jgi:hypothetical protein
VNLSAKKRLSRIRRRAIPAVQQAFENGQVSARRCDILLYLPADQQQAWLDQHRVQEERYSRAAHAITDYLRTLPAGSQPRLDLLAQSIRAAIATG